MNVRQFLETWPLYRTLTLRTWMWPTTISLWCGNCKKETTWKIANEGATQGDLSMRKYECQLCDNPHGKCRVQYVLQVRMIYKDGKPDHGLVTKVGQYPPQTIAIPPEMEKELSSEGTEFYKRSLISRNHGFGLGAVAYVRRVVEDKTNKMIDVVAEYAKEHGANEEAVAAIIEAKKQKRYEDRIRVASDVLPTSLRPTGRNPLAELYRLLSEGLHAKSEEECLQIADDTREVFEFTFANLRLQTEGRKQFAERLEKMALRKAPSAPAPAVAAETQPKDEKAGS